jgi:hypothetical protein
MLNYTIFRKYGLINTTVENNDVFCKELENVLKTLYPNQDKILYIISDDNNDVDSIVISLKKLRQKFESKCIELNINLTEKLSA